jgi:hypothetical protein
MLTLVLAFLDIYIYTYCRSTHHRWKLVVASDPTYEASPPTAAAAAASSRMVRKKKEEEKKKKSAAPWTP